MFASRVQRAFSVTNRAMLEQADVLRRDYEDLLTSWPALEREDENWLNQELEALKKCHDGLQWVLKRHHDWQQMHDELERLDNCKGTSQFAIDLDRFLDNREAMDRLLADAAQLARASAQAERWQEKINAAGQHLNAVASDRTSRPPSSRKRLQISQGGRGWRAPARYAEASARGPTS